MRLRGLIWAIALAVLGVAGAAPGVPAASAGPTADSSTPLPVHEADVVLPNYRFRDGEALAKLRLHYATLGEPHRNTDGQIDNAILILHWTSASGQALLTPEYQTALFAAGAPFDAKSYFVIVPDAIGHGRSSKPSDGLKARFPHYGYGDMVDLQHKLVSQMLGVTHLRAVVGMLMGCMNAWQWAEDYPSMMDGILPVACFPSPITGRNLLWRRMVVDAIRSDPAWMGGEYPHPPPSVSKGLEMLRLMIDGVPHLEAAVGTRESADSLIRDIQLQATGLDANDVEPCTRNTDKVPLPALTANNQL